MGEIEARIEARAAELRAEIAALEAVGAPCNELEIQKLRARLAEVEGLLAADPNWRRRIRERRVLSAVEGFTRGRRR